MSTQLMPTPVADDLATNDKPVVHAVCRSCFPVPGPDDVGMCGERPATLAISPTPPADRPLCVICEELYPKACAKCGGGGFR